MSERKVRNMWRSAVVHLSCSVLASGLLTTAWYYVAPFLFNNSLIGFLILSVCLVLLLTLRQSARSEGIAAGLYLFSNAVWVTIVCLNHQGYIREHLPFEPFVGIKIMALFLPSNSPPWKWVGLSTLGLLFLTPMFIYYSWDPASEAVVSIQEPWVSEAVVLCAVVIYLAMLKIIALREAEAEAHGKISSLRKIAHFLLGAKHMLSTPLQTIELTFNLLEQAVPIGNIARVNAEKAFAIIRRINRALSFADSSIEWDSLQLPKDVDALETEGENIMREINATGELGTGRHLQSADARSFKL